MLPWKAAFLALAVFAVFFLDHSVNGAEVCTEQDETQVLLHCNMNIKNGKFTLPAPKAGVCCQLVRMLQSKDIGMMECIVKHLTDEEKREHSVVKIMELVGRCVIPQIHPSSDEGKLF